MPESPPMPPEEELLLSPGVNAIFEVVARLRAPDGCPWDREQTHESVPARPAGGEDPRSSSR